MDRESIGKNSAGAKAARRAFVLQGRFRRFFSNLGPGLITGAADDDPSGIATYSVTGAAFGYAPLWTALFSFPLMAAIQIMCARLGMVTGLGLAGVIRVRYPRWVLWGACSLLVIANIVNIAADLGGMADVTQLLTGVRSLYWTPVYAIVLVWLLFQTSYRLIARIFKWLTVVLFAYIAAAFFAHPNWGAVLRATVFPHVKWSAAFWATLVGILGTTISPYLFFWQAAQEVEEDIAAGKSTVAEREGASHRALRRSRNDVLTGMFFSNLVMYFIILTSAATLHVHGNTSISTAREAAEALRPLAGNGAYWLFSLGLIGAGMLGVPVLAGSCAYAIAEAADWVGSLDVHPPVAHGFYAVIAIAMAIGLGLDYAGFNAVKMLFWSAVLNGALAPPLLVIVVLLTSRADVMGEHRNGPLLRWLGWTCAGVMLIATVIMIVTAFLV
jgi:NRAMP (natural resistance-associated macrophage protein)-like metal ion transporter